MLATLLALALTQQNAALPPPPANPPRSRASSDKLPPANPLPPPDGSDERAVLATIDRAFAALAARDATAIAAEFRPAGLATVVAEQPGGGATIRHIPWTDYFARLKPGPERYQESITDPAVEIDGDLAMVWAPYVFRIDGKVDHCGTDHFDLVRENGTWKIVNISWTQRSTGCPA